MSHPSNPALNPALHDVSAHHSHAKMYRRNAITLTLLTVVEIGLLFVPDMLHISPALHALSHDLMPALMTILAAVKFGLVVGLFMHLADDSNVFKVVFLAPLVMAMAMIVVMGWMVMRHWDAYGKNYPALFTQKDHDTRMGLKKASAAAAPKLSAEAYDKLFTDTKDFSAGEALFKSKCSACHGANAGGVAGLGPNMTDNCFKHGPTIHNSVAVILNGVPGTAMVSMSSQLKEDEITQVALYVRSLRGTNVAGGKECEGEKAE